MYVWESVGQDLGGHGIVGRSYPNGEGFVINSQRNLDQYDPAIAADNQGRVIVTWANTGGATSSGLSANTSASEQATYLHHRGQRHPLYQPFPAPRPLPTSCRRPKPRPQRHGGQQQRQQPQHPGHHAHWQPRPFRNPNSQCCLQSRCRPSQYPQWNHYAGVAAAPGQPTRPPSALTAFPPLQPAFRLNHSGQAASSALQQIDATTATARWQFLCLWEPYPQWRLPAAVKHLLPSVGRR